MVIEFYPQQRNTQEKHRKEEREILNKQKKKRKKYKQNKKGILPHNNYKFIVHRSYYRSTCEK